MCNPEIRKRLLGISERTKFRMLSQHDQYSQENKMVDDRSSLQAVFFRERLTKRVIGTFIIMKSHSREKNIAIPAATTAVKEISMKYPGIPQYEQNPASYSYASM